MREREKERVEHDMHKSPRPRTEPFDVSVQRRCAAPVAQSVERATLRVIPSVSVKLFPAGYTVE